jgi:hypothetical protein
LRAHIGEGRAEQDQQKERGQPPPQEDHTRMIPERTTRC